VWRGVFSRYQLSVLQFNFNSDTVYLEIASDSTGKDSVLQESTLPTTLDATHKPRLLSVLGINWLKAQHSENEDHGIWSHHFMANRWGNTVETVKPEEGVLGTSIYSQLIPSTDNNLGL